MEKIKVALTTKIEAHGECIGTLEFRNPLGGDIRKLGFPFKSSPDGELTVDQNVTAKYIEALAGIPPSSVDRMSVADYQNCMAKVLDFFVSTPSTS